jgi:hypothetical protein
MSKSSLRAGALSTAEAYAAVAAIAAHPEALGRGRRGLEPGGSRHWPRPAVTTEQPGARNDAPIRAEAKAFQCLIERAPQTRASARAALAYLVERMSASLGLAFGAEATAALLAALARPRALED